MITDEWVSHKGVYVLVQVDVRDLDPQDLPEVARLCVVARDESVLGTQLCVAESEKLQRHLGTYAQLPDSHVLVASIENQVVGFGLVRVVTPGMFIDEAAVYLEAIYVSENARRRGVGHHLLAHVVSIANEAGAQDIYALPLPGSRGVQRFLSRLGFAPAAAHRVVAVSALSRNIATELKRSPRRTGGRMLDDLIARRRKARIETNSGPLDLRAFQAAYAADQAKHSSRVASGE